MQHEEQQQEQQDEDEEEGGVHLHPPAGAAVKSRSYRYAGQWRV